MKKYTIAMCNFEMGNTIRKSVESIISQIPKSDFDVLVVDAGSNDDSKEVLEELESEYDNFRAIFLDKDSSRHLGRDRQISIEKSNSEYVIFDLDCDDVYYEGILDFVKVYHKIEEQREDDFILKGEAINMAPKSLLEDIPFRNLKVAEDKDLYRRALDEEAIIYIKHNRFWEEMEQSEKDRKDLLYRIFDEQISHFRSGISIVSYINWILFVCTDYTRYTWKRRGAELILMTLTVPISIFSDRYSQPEPFNRMGMQYIRRFEERKTLDEIEDYYNIEINKNELSDNGIKIFYEDIKYNEIPENRSEPVKN